MAPGQGLLTFLKAHKDARLDGEKVDTRRLRAWLMDLDASTRSGVRRAWLVGRALNVEKAKIPYGEVDEWVKKRARELGRTTRTLYIFRYIAEALDDNRIEMSLQKSHAEKGVNGVLHAIRRIRKKQSDGESPEIADKVAAWRKRAQRLLKAVPVGDLRAKLLQELLEDVKAMLDNEPERAAPAVGGQTVQEAVEAYIKHLRSSRVGGNELREAFGILNRFAAEMDEERPLADIGLGEVRAFAATVTTGVVRPVALDNEGIPVALQKALDWWRLQGWLSHWS